MFSASKLLVSLFAVGIAMVNAESHTITMVNRCGTGTPIISQNFVTLSTSGSYTATGSFAAVIAYLDTGCGFQGTGCALVETSLINGAVSSTDISLISPNAFNVATSFVYTGGCAGTGASCTSASCSSTEAFHVTTDYSAQRQCLTDDSGLTITFC